MNTNSNTILGTLDPELIGRMAIVDGSAATNPIQFSADEYASILRHAVAGVL